MEQQQRCAFECLWQWRCSVRGLAAFVLPLLALWAVIKALWILLPSEWFETRTLSTLDLSDVKLSGFAHAIDGRMNFSIMSVAVWAAGLIAMLLAVAAMRRTLCTAGTAIAFVLAAATGAGVANWESNYHTTVCDGTYPPATVHVDKNEGFRAVVIDNLMCVAERSQPPEKRRLETTKNMILANTYFGFIGAAAVMAAFGVLAMRYGDGWAAVGRLRRRLDDFRTLTLMAGILFVLNALVTKSLVNWTQGLLASEADAAEFARLGSALLNYWATQASTVLIVALGLAAVFIQCDITAAAREKLSEPVKPEPAANSAAAPGAAAASSAGAGKIPTETTWKEENELTFDSATAVSAALGIIAPFLAGPAVDLVTKALH